MRTRLNLYWKKMNQVFLKNILVKKEYFQMKGNLLKQLKIAHILQEASIRLRVKMEKV